MITSNQVAKKEKRKEEDVSMHSVYEYTKEPIILKIYYVASNLFSFFFLNLLFCGEKTFI